MNDLRNTTRMAPWRSKMNEIIFGAETRAGKWFDIILLLLILLSVVAIFAESVPSIRAQYIDELHFLEWIFTGIFSLEYIARIVSVKKPFRYIFSFWGFIDLISILPTYIGIFYTGTGALRILRCLRLLRIFRILNLSQFVEDSNKLITALIASRNKIIVFLFTVIMLVTVLGTIMYLVEDEAAGFDSIPRSIYWAIVTMTTVGYGDISPATGFGQFIASIVMILGYAIIAVPTGIVTNEFIKESRKSVNNDLNNNACANCGKDGHDVDAAYCNHCGHQL